MKTFWWLLLVALFLLCWGTFKSEARTSAGSLIQDLNNINKMDVNIFSNFGQRHGAEVNILPTVGIKVN